MFRLSRIGQDKVCAALLLACLGIGMPAWGFGLPPVPNNQTVGTNEDSAISITLTATDPEGDPLLFTIASPPANGSLSGIAPNVTYTPAANFNGTDSFKFNVSDGTSMVTGTITINVNPVNDPPQFVASPSPVVVNEDSGTVTVNLGGMFTDVDGDPLALTVSGFTNSSLYASAPTVSGTTLTLNFGANRNGASTVTIK